MRRSACYNDIISVGRMKRPALSYAAHALAGGMPVPQRAQWGEGTALCGGVGESKFRGSYTTA